MGRFINNINNTYHVLYKEESNLDYERLVEIYNKVDIPLVIHGSSDVPYDMGRKSIELGISKVNIATDLKIHFQNALRGYLIDNPKANDLRKYMLSAKEAMKKIVADKIKICNSANKG